MADTRLGIFSKLYVNDGTYVAPVWEQVDLIGDLAIAGSWNRGESTVRRARVQTNEPTLLVLDLTGNVRVDHTDDGYNLLRDAFLDPNTTLDVLVLNGAHTRNGSLGFRFDAKVFAMGEDQARGNVLFNDLELGPCASDNLPQSVIVTGGVPVFTEIAIEPT